MLDLSEIIVDVQRYRRPCKSGCYRFVLTCSFVVTTADIFFPKDFIEVFAPHILEVEDLDATTRAALINDYVEVKKSI